VNAGRKLVTLLAASAATLVVLEAQAPLKIATVAPDNSIYVRSLREMAEAWKKRTGGRVTAHIYPGGDESEGGMLRNLRPTFRKLHGAQLSSIVLGTVEPAFNVFGLPMFYESYDEADRVLAALAPELEARLEAKGYKALNFVYVGWVHIFSKRPITTVDDLRKLPLYTSTGDDRLARWYRANGFMAVPLDATSMLTSLQTNMIQAVPAPPLFAQLLTWYRSAPYMMDLGFAPLLGSTVVRLDTWNGLAANDQAAVAAEAKRAGAQLRSDVPRLEREAIEAMKRMGLTVTRADAVEWRRIANDLGEAMRKDGLVPGDIYERARRERDAARTGR
jgi:TRAP-type C4-dicarboxylate transport system substrate-binding protein